MFNANVYEVFIASPSDVITERDSAEQILYEWNSLNSYKSKIVLQPVRWEKSVYSDFSSSPQDVINKQVLESVDILVAIFHSKIGSPTKNYESGTVEEFKTHIQNNKPAMVFFSKEPIEQKNINHEQLELLYSFKDWCNSKGIYVEYGSKENFKELFRNHITLLINKLPVTSPSENQNEPVSSRVKQDALDFISKISFYKSNIAALEKHFIDIGHYRSMELNPFLEEAGILKLLNHSDGSYTIQIKSNFRALSDEDIKLFIQDIHSGKYDMYFK
jgi:hypothetical protein